MDHPNMDRAMNITDGATNPRLSHRATILEKKIPKADLALLGPFDRAAWTEQHKYKDCVSIRCMLAEAKECNGCARYWVYLKKDPESFQNRVQLRVNLRANGESFENVVILPLTDGTATGEPFYLSPLFRELGITKSEQLVAFMAYHLLLAQVNHREGHQVHFPVDEDVIKSVQNLCNDIRKAQSDPVVARNENPERRDAQNEQVPTQASRKRKASDTPKTSSRSANARRQQSSAVGTDSSPDVYAQSDDAMNISEDILHEGPEVADAETQSSAEIRQSSISASLSTLIRAETFRVVEDHWDEITEAAIRQYHTNADHAQSGP